MHANTKPKQTNVSPTRAGEQASRRSKGAGEQGSDLHTRRVGKNLTYLVVPRGEVGAGVKVHEQAAPEGVPGLRPAEGGVRAVVHHVQQGESLACVRFFFTHQKVGQRDDDDDEGKDNKK